MDFIERESLFILLILLLLQKTIEKKEARYSSRSRRLGSGYGSGWRYDDSGGGGGPWDNKSSRLLFLNPVSGPPDALRAIRLASAELVFMSVDSDELCVGDCEPRSW